MKPAHSKRPRVIRFSLLLGDLVRHPQLPEIVTRGQGRMGRLQREILAASASEQPVLVSGLTGTGKEIVARAIHRLSRRSKRPFVATNCAELSEGVFESELFGHARGAFTGAIRDRKGLLRSASGGSLFLDELNRMPTRLQLKLLRVVEGDKAVRAVGHDPYVPTDVRIISACNKGVKEALYGGELEWELFWRLGVIRIYLPPLSDRREDIPLLVAAIIDERINPERESKVMGISRAAMKLLTELPWPGNVRQLEHLLKGALAMLPQVETIEAAHLRRPLADLVAPVESPGEELLPPLPATDGRSLAEAMRGLALWFVDRAIARAGGDKESAAKSLGISLRTLNRYLERRQQGVARGGTRDTIDSAPGSARPRVRKASRGSCASSRDRRDRNKSPLSQRARAALH